LSTIWGELQTGLPGKGHIREDHLGESGPKDTEIETNAAKLDQDEGRPEHQDRRLPALLDTAHQGRQIKPMLATEMSLQLPADGVQAPDQHPAQNHIQRARIQGEMAQAAIKKQQSPSDDQQQLQEHEQTKIDRNVERRGTGIEQQRSGRACADQHPEHQGQTTAEHGQLLPEAAGKHLPRLTFFLSKLQTPYRQPPPYQQPGLHLFHLAQMRFDLGKVNGPVALGQRGLTLLMPRLIILAAEKMQIDQIGDIPQTTHNRDSNRGHAARAEQKQLRRGNILSYRGRLVVLVTNGEDDVPSFVPD
jgi:hypothetical protein